MLTSAGRLEQAGRRHWRGDRHGRCDSGGSFLLLLLLLLLLSPQELEALHVQRAHLWRRLCLLSSCLRRLFRAAEE